MKILSASLFIALGLAIGTTVSALATGAAGATHIALDPAVKDYAGVTEHDATPGFEDAGR